MWVESVLNHLVPDEQKLDVSMRHDTDWLLQWMDGYSRYSCEM